MRPALYAAAAAVAFLGGLAAYIALGGVSTVSDDRENGSQAAHVAEIGEFTVATAYPTASPTKTATATATASPTASPTPTAEPTATPTTVPAAAAAVVGQDWSLSGGVEQWRELVASIFPAEAVQSVLWIMRCESSGNPTVVGAAGERGLLQIHPVHGAAWAAAFDPEVNIRTAYALSAGGTYWRPWDGPTPGRGAAWASGAPCDWQPGVQIIPAPSPTPIVVMPTITPTPMVTIPPEATPTRPPLQCLAGRQIVICTPTPEAQE